MARAILVGEVMTDVIVSPRTEAFWAHWCADGSLAASGWAINHATKPRGLRLIA
jgi:hypothetical protein